MSNEKYKILQKLKENLDILDRATSKDLLMKCNFGPYWTIGKLTFKNSGCLHSSNKNSPQDDQGR
jgi:hypothetical protein